jgi:hypothetical protein
MKTPEDLDTKGKSFKKFVESLLGEKTFSSEEELREFFRYEFDDEFEGEPAYNELFLHSLEKIRAGWFIFQRSVSYGDESGYDTIEEMRKNPNFQILEEDQ